MIFIKDVKETAKMTNTDILLEDLKNEKFICISETESEHGAKRIIETCKHYGFEPNIKNMSQILIL